MSAKKYKKTRVFWNNKDLSERGLKDGILNTVVWFHRAECENPEVLYQLRTCVYELNDNATIQYHNIKPANKVRSIPQFDDISNKVILLNCDSGSARLNEKQKAYFKKIVVFLRSKHYIVYQNIIAGQTPMKGCLSLRCDLTELLAIAQKVPLVISIRSGILDFIVTTNINMFVVYCDSTRIKMNPLSQWNCKGHYKEICSEDIQDDKDLSIFKEFAVSIGLDV